MLKHRLLYGLLVAAAFAAGMSLFSGWMILALLAVFVGAAQWEFYRLAQRGGYEVQPFFGIALGMVWMAAVFILGSPLSTAVAPHGWELGLLLAMLFGVLLRCLCDPRTTRPFEAVGILLLGLAYGPFLLSYYLRLAQWGATAPMATTRGGVFLAFYLSFVVKMSDAGAYAFGMTLGRHKLWPRVSPAKSWEGLAGGLLVAVLCAAGLAAAAATWEWGPAGIFWARTGMQPLLTPVGAGVIGLLLAGVGVLGDLFESMFKRAVKAKDSSSIIPGMGGVLDVIDSLVFAPALFFACLAWLKS